MEEKQQYLILLVENHSGVLTRVSSLFCQRGFNIDSLNVSTTDNPNISRITIVSHGDDRKFRQICDECIEIIRSAFNCSCDSRNALHCRLKMCKSI